MLGNMATTGERSQLISLQHNSHRQREWTHSGAHGVRGGVDVRHGQVVAHVEQVDRRQRRAGQQPRPASPR